MCGPLPPDPVGLRKAGTSSPTLASPYSTNLSKAPERQASPHKRSCFWEGQKSGELYKQPQKPWARETSRRVKAAGTLGGAQTARLSPGPPWVAGPAPTPSVAQTPPQRIPPAIQGPSALGAPAGHSLPRAQAGFPSLSPTPRLQGRLFTCVAHFQVPPWAAAARVISVPGPRRRRCVLTALAYSCRTSGGDKGVRLAADLRGGGGWLR